MFRRICVVLGSLGLGAALMWPGRGRGDEPPPPPAPVSEEASEQGTTTAAQEGVEVLAQGPVHEAFAEPSIRLPQPTPVVPKQPPDPIEEIPPDQKPAGDNVQWIPGYWAWDGDRQNYIWVSGIWRDIPPGRQWVPGNWMQVEGGWQWVPGYWAVQEQAEVEYLPEPPAPVAEAPPPQPNPSDVYVPGTWVYNDTRYMWRPGFWMAYQPGWLWVPAHYVWSPSGYVFVDGYWDLPLTNRGLMFAPVAFQADLWRRPNWFYQPRYTVPTDFLLGCLFVRMDVCHYYFGDYFAPEYRRRNFVSWVDFRVGERFYDPLLTYYRWEHRDRPNWVRDLREVYVGREEGRIPRPPRTLVQQTTVVNNNQFVTINNIKNVNVTNVTNITNITNLAPLATVAQVRQAGVPLHRLSQNQLVAERRVAQDYRTLSRERAHVQAQMVTRAGAAGGARAMKTPVRAELPGLKTFARVNTPAGGTATTRRAVPPAPAIPKMAAHTGAGAAGRTIDGTRTAPGLTPEYGGQGTRPLTTEERRMRAAEQPGQGRQLTQPPDLRRGQGLGQPGALTQPTPPHERGATVPGQTGRTPGQMGQPLEERRGHTVTTPPEPQRFGTSPGNPGMQQHQPPATQQLERRPPPTPPAVERRPAPTPPAVERRPPPTPPAVERRPAGEHTPPPRKPEAPPKPPAKEGHEKPPK